MSSKFWKKYRKHLLVFLAALLVLSGSFFWRAQSAEAPQQTQETGMADLAIGETANSWLESLSEWVGVESDEIPVRPDSPDMERMKSQGCVADGLLSDYGDNYKRNVQMINRSNCYYLHRALETWLEAPDFEKAQKIKKKIEKDDLVYGMFIAEAIDKKAKLFYPAEDRYFDFSAMCRKNFGDNYWGEHTCIPSFEREEYRKYVLYITEKAMDMGIQSFLFGQIRYQEEDIHDPQVTELIFQMKEKAKFFGIEIVVGAQTNDTDNEEYLQNFDYIEGGVGLRNDGSVENGPCFSRWWKQDGDWCWALLWNERFSSKAKNVFVHFDWSGKLGDDMSTFARMNDDLRAQTLQNLHSYFVGKDVGFMMPMLAVLPKDNGGCHGKSRKFYSADRKYSCGDEEVINDILKKAQ